MNCKNSNKADNKMKESLNELPCDGCGKHFSHHIQPTYNKNGDSVYVCDECNLKDLEEPKK